MSSSLAVFRAFYARRLAAMAAAGAAEDRLSQAFEAVPREAFLEKGPWRVFTGTRYIVTPSDDPALVHHRSGSGAPLPAADVIYVSAGATAPLDVWLDALRPGGRLMFPLTPAEGPGGMLLVTRRSGERYDASFVSTAMFIPCIGAREEETAQKLTVAFQRGGTEAVSSLYRRKPVDDTCWVAGEGWWLSTF